MGLLERKIPLWSQSCWWTLSRVPPCTLMHFCQFFVCSHLKIDQTFRKKVNKKSNKSNMNWTIESNWTRNKLSGQKVEKIHHCALLWSNCSSILWGMPNFLRWKSTKIKNLELNVFESADFLRPLLNRNPWLCKERIRKRVIYQK